MLVRSIELGLDKGVKAILGAEILNQQLVSARDEAHLPRRLTNRNARIGTDSSASHHNHLSRLEERVGDVLKNIVRLRLDVLCRHLEKNEQGRLPGMNLFEEDGNATVDVYGGRQKRQNGNK